MKVLYNYKQFLSINGYSETTKENYIECVNLFLKFIQETKGNTQTITLCNLSQSDIYNYIAYLDHLSTNTKKNRLFAIKNFYFFLNPKISDFLFQDIKLFKNDKKTPRILSSVQLRQLYSYYPDERNQLIIYIFCSTGIRLSELANIQIENINYDLKRMKCMCKGGIERNVFLNDKCVSLIQNYVGNKKSGKLFNLKRRQIQYIVTNAINKLGFKGTTHTLRHSIATIMYNQTKDIMLVKEFLGHKSVTSTEIYTHIENENIIKAINEVRI